jgi:predicted dienelactone hydrolase
MLPVTVRYPATGRAGAGARTAAAVDRSSGPFPLVVFSEGYAASVGEYAGLLNSIARAGYVVAAPTYPRTDPTAPGGLSEADIVNHPGDLRFVISEMLGASRNPADRLHGILALRRVAVIGHSDGGDVSLAVVANSCCRDPRVSAAVILSGAEFSAFGGRYFATSGVPLLVVQGTADTINPPACSVQLYNAAPSPKYYLEIPGAEHQPPYLDPGPMRVGVSRSVVAFLSAYLRGNVRALSAVEHGDALPASETLSSGPSAPPVSGSSCPGAP